MHEPVLPFMEHVHAPPGPHTIGFGGAASSMSAQSLSVEHGFCGIAQMPQPEIAPPGLHESVDGQSFCELQMTAPSGNVFPPPSTMGDGAASPAHEMLLVTTFHAPLLHIAVVAHP
jgi:hypothetical protein